MKKSATFFLIVAGLMALLTLPSCCWDREHRREEWREHHRGDQSWSGQRLEEHEEREEAAPIMRY